MLQDKILSTINRYRLISSLDKVLIGVSGGPDSLALLYLFNELKVKLGIRIVIVHLNHGLRGRSSDSDEKFVKGIANNLGLDFLSKRIKWPNLKSRLPNEERLRKARYDFFFDVAKKYKINKIALAHTLDDQAETVLMRLIRGTGLYGLISILPKRRVESFTPLEKRKKSKSSLTGFTIIRPLIEISRAEVENYLKKIKVKGRVDSTNFNKTFLRNKVRHDILKNLNKINPNVKGVLARFAQQAAIDYDYLYKEAERFIIQNGKSSVRIELGRFCCLHTAIQRMIIRVALEKVAGDLRTFTNKHWQEIQDLVNTRPFNSIVHLTKEVVVKKDRKYIVVFS